MKKLVAFVLCLFLAVTGVFSLGFGVQGGASVNIMRGGDVGLGGSGDAALTLRLSQDSPFVFGLGGYDSFRSFNLFVDWWMLNFPVGERFNFYAGLGAYGGIALSPFAFEVGGRVPVGVNAFFLDGFLEGYVQATPSVGFGLGDSGGLAAFVPITLGIRVWLDNMPDFGGIKTDLNKGLGSFQSLQAGAMQAAFAQVFSTVFCIGGLYPDYSTLKEGQGVVWLQSYADESEKTQTTTELALLKKLDNGDSWWYICMDDEEGKLEYEGLLDSQMRVKRIRYKEDGETEEYVFPTPTSASENNSSFMGLGLGGISSLGMNFTMETVGDFVQGEETVKVPAGTWKAKKSVYEYGSSKDLTSFNWFCTDEVPGLLIKYEHNYGADLSSKGDLQSLKDGYKTKMDSY